MLLHHECFGSIQSYTYLSSWPIILCNSCCGCILGDDGKSVLDDTLLLLSIPDVNVVFSSLLLLSYLKLQWSDKLIIIMTNSLTQHRTNKHVYVYVCACVFTHARQLDGFLDNRRRFMTIFFYFLLLCSKQKQLHFYNIKFCIGFAIFLLLIFCCC